MRGIVTNGADQKPRPIPDKKHRKSLWIEEGRERERGRRSICCVGRVSCEVGSEMGRKWTTQITTATREAAKSEMDTLFVASVQSPDRPL